MVAHKSESLELTEQVLHDMLQENTGVHMLDSGMAYGRHWQQNQARDFENEPVSMVRADGGKYGSMYAIHNVYHWLKSRLIYNEEIDNDFHQFATEGELEHEPWLYCMEKYMEKLQDEDENVGGIYGEGDPFVINTYNEEDCLSQVLQFAYWEDEDGEHVLLQIHGGADVRGGYTAPRAFDVSGDTELAMFDYSRAVISCTDQKPKHDPDQTCFPGAEPEDCRLFWDFQGSYCEHVGDHHGMERLELEPVKLVFVDHDADPEDTPDGEPPAPGKGYVYVDEDEISHCPVCGSPLESYFF